jgi:hypothetical protein
VTDVTAAGSSTGSAIVGESSTAVAVGVAELVAAAVGVRFRLVVAVDRLG